MHPQDFTALINSEHIDTHVSRCIVCHDGGDLICCDGCPHAYHQGERQLLVFIVTRQCNRGRFDVVDVKRLLCARLVALHLVPRICTAGAASHA